MCCGASSAARSATAISSACEEPFFYRLVAPLASEMGEAYPELARPHAQVERVLELEEERFAETLEQGMRILDEAIAGLSGTEIPGETVFKLYDTYGFPIDLTADIARERGLQPGHGGVRTGDGASKGRGRGPPASSAPGEGAALELEGETEFTGYERLDDRGHGGRACISDGEPCDELSRRRGGHGRAGRHPLLRRVGRPGR